MENILNLNGIKHHFKAIDYDARLDLNGIYLFEGKRWDMLVDDENFNYDYLMGADVDLIILRYNKNC